MFNELRLQEIYNDMNEEIPALVTADELAMVEADQASWVEVVTLCVTEGFEPNTFELTWA